MSLCVVCHCYFNFLLWYSLFGIREKPCSADEYPYTYDCPWESAVLYSCLQETSRLSVWLSFSQVTSVISVFCSTYSSKNRKTLYDPTEYHCIPCIYDVAIIYWIVSYATFICLIIKRQYMIHVMMHVRSTSIYLINFDNFKSMCPGISREDSNSINYSFV